VAIQASDVVTIVARAPLKSATQKKIVGPKNQIKSTHSRIVPSVQYCLADVERCFRIEAIAIHRATLSEPVPTESVRMRAISSQPSASSMQRCRSGPSVRTACFIAASASIGGSWSLSMGRDINLTE
jgi:hypothetical protein